MTLPENVVRGKRSRRRGKNGELEVVHLLHAVGYRNAERTSRGTAQGAAGDISFGPADVHLEVRWRQTCAIWAWLRDAEAKARATDIPVVVMRRNRMQWWSVMPADEWFALHELTALPAYTLVRSSRQCTLWAWLEQAQTECPGQQIPVVRFSRPDSEEYAAVPSTVVFGLLRERETA